MAITATKPTSDEDWYKFLNLNANSANSTNLATDEGSFRSIQNLGSIKNIKIDKKPRSKIKPSDHTPIEIEIT